MSTSTSTYAPPGAAPASKPSRHVLARFVACMVHRILLVVGAARRRTREALGALNRQWQVSQRHPEAGLATAEYAIATLAAAAFAGLLLVILGGDEVRGFLTDLIRRALQV